MASETCTSGNWAGPVLQEFAVLSPAARAMLAASMDAVVIVDPIQYQRHPGEPADPPALLRTPHFGQHHEGLVDVYEE